jgi:hypothetical protein
MGDFTDDGTTDILLGNVIDWVVQGGVYSDWNDEVGNPAAAGYGIIGTGDFNNDGNQDILLQNGNGNIIDWTLQNGHYAG